MPELPEVEQFRHLLLPLVKNNNNNNTTTTTKGKEENKLFQIVQYEMNHKGINLTKEQVVNISQNYYCSSVVRKGKQLCLILKYRSAVNATTGTSKSTTAVNSNNAETLFFYLHMGMTGCIRIPGRAENWGDRKDTESSTGTGEEVPLKVKSKRKGMLLKSETTESLQEKGVKPNKYIQSTADDNTNEGSGNDEIFPPKYTILTFEYDGYKAAFTDSRKFGSCSIIVPSADAEDPFQSFGLAPDSYTTTDTKICNEYIIPKIMNQSVGIKAILLDQKRAVSGVGNWIADEILYQCKIHPDQKFLSHDEACAVWNKVNEVCTIAVDCLTKHNTHYPIEWLFGYRWTNKKAGKDYYGQSISFLTSGGRTSAIIPSQQKLYSRSKAAKQATSKGKKGKASESTGSESKPATIDKTDLNDTAVVVSQKSSSGSKRKAKSRSSDDDTQDLEPVQKKKKQVRNMKSDTNNNNNNNSVRSTRQTSRRKSAETKKDDDADDSSNNMAPNNEAPTNRIRNVRSSKTEEAEGSSTSKYFDSSKTRTKTTKTSRKSSSRKQSQFSLSSTNSARPTTPEKESVVVPTSSEQEYNKEEQIAIVPLRPGLRPRTNGSTSKYFVPTGIEQRKAEPTTTKKKQSAEKKKSNGEGKADENDQQDLQIVTVVHHRESPNIVTPIPGDSDSGSS